MNKHVRECVKICEDGGLTDLKIVKGGKHLKVYSDQEMVVLPCTPSDKRWRHNVSRNVRSLLRD